jgi:actin related protein 2/3 complex subunit 2
VAYGASDVIQREYGSWIASSVEPDYSISLSFDSDKVPADPGESSLFSSLLSRILTVPPPQKNNARP